MRLHLQASAISRPAPSTPRRVLWRGAKDMVLAVFLQANREARSVRLSTTRELLQPARMTRKGAINTWQTPLLSAPARQAVA